MESLALSCLFGSVFHSSLSTKNYLFPGAYFRTVRIAKVAGNDKS